MKTPSSSLALAGKTKATYLVLDLLKRERTLLGLEMPTKHELSGPEGGPVPVDSRQSSAGWRV